jgi:protein-tyrosine phosphatase
MLPHGPQMHRVDWSRTEHIEQAQKRDAKIQASALVPQTNDSVAEPLKIPGITYHEVNFNGSAFSRMLISKLTWMETFRLIGLMIFGYRLDAIKILAPTMESMGLIGLAISSLDVCTKEVKQIFDFLGDEANWPTLVHCTQGKDRTGLIIMLLLFLLNVDISAIDKDYMLSGPELEAERPGRIKEIQSIGLSEQFALCAPNVVEKVHAHVQEKFGGVEGYLQSTGVTLETMERVKKILRNDEAASRLAEGE